MKLKLLVIENYLTLIKDKLHERKGWVGFHKTKDDFKNNTINTIGEIVGEVNPSVLLIRVNNDFDIPVPIKHCVNIFAHRPMGESQVLDGVDLLPEFEFDDDGHVKIPSVFKPTIKRDFVDELEGLEFKLRTKTTLDYTIDSFGIKTYKGEYIYRNLVGDVKHRYANDQGFSNWASLTKFYMSGNRPIEDKFEEFSHHYDNIIKNLIDEK